MVSPGKRPPLSLADMQGPAQSPIGAQPGPLGYMSQATKESSPKSSSKQMLLAIVVSAVFTAVCLFGFTASKSDVTALNANVQLLSTKVDTSTAITDSLAESVDTAITEARSVKGVIENYALKSDLRPFTQAGTKLTTLEATVAGLQAALSDLASTAGPVTVIPPDLTALESAVVALTVNLESLSTSVSTVLGPRLDAVEAQAADADAALVALASQVDGLDVGATAGPLVEATVLASSLGYVAFPAGDVGAVGASMALQITNRSGADIDGLLVRMSLEPRSYEPWAWYINYPRVIGGPTDWTFGSSFVNVSGLAVPAQTTIMLPLTLHMRAATAPAQTFYWEPTVQIISYEVR